MLPDTYYLHKVAHSQPFEEVFVEEPDLILSLLIHY